MPTFRHADAQQGGDEQVKGVYDRPDVSVYRLRRKHVLPEALVSRVSFTS
jgi:hypothetical protein